tara:strand:- start:111758 stop:111913 length:156 start_codon:yes stop_codon:yes gene_type:complete
MQRLRKVLANSEVCQINRFHENLYGKKRRQNQKTCFCNKDRSVFNPRIAQL